MVDVLGAYRPITLEERFWRSVDKDGPLAPRPELGHCWLWTAKTNEHGYGLFSVKGRHVRAHRVAWEMHHERQIPPGQVVRHRCDVRICVRHDHLMLGTHADNGDDAARRRRGTVPLGEKVPSAKLTAEQVQWARQQYDSKLNTCAGLARILNVSQTTMSAVLKRESWQHVK
jgi:hypothetical protein